MLPVIEIAADETEPKTAVTEPEAQIAEPDQEEAQLTAEVDTLWLAHNEANALRKHTAAELRAIKLKLGERLHTVKQLLSKPGRGGQWNSFLRSKKIPRSSADRLIDRHLESIGESAPTGAISPEDAIEKLLTFLAEKLKRVLPDEVERYQAAYRLLNKLGLQVEEADESFIVLEPEVEADEPYDEEFGGHQLMPPGEVSAEALGVSVTGGTGADPVPYGAVVHPAIIPADQERQIEL